MADEIIPPINLNSNMTTNLLNVRSEPLAEHLDQIFSPKGLPQKSSIIFKKADLKKQIIKNKNASETSIDRKETLSDCHQNIGSSYKMGGGSVKMGGAVSLK